MYATLSQNSKMKSANMHTIFYSDLKKLKTLLEVEENINGYLKFYEKVSKGYCFSSKHTLREFHSIFYSEAKTFHREVSLLSFLLAKHLKHQEKWSQSMQRKDQSPIGQMNNKWNIFIMLSPLPKGLVCHWPNILLTTLQGFWPAIYCAWYVIATRRRGVAKAAGIFSRSLRGFSGKLMHICRVVPSSAMKRKRSSALIMIKKQNFCCYNCNEEGHYSWQCTKPKHLLQKVHVMTQKDPEKTKNVPYNLRSQTENPNSSNSQSEKESRSHSNLFD